MAAAGNRRARMRICLAAVALAAFAIVAALHASGVLAFAESKTYDARMASTARLFAPSDDICFIGIDQQSLTQAQQERGWSWPWPREAYGMIARYLMAGGARSLVFDVFFTEPSVYGPADDEAFAAACAEYGAVVQVMYHAPGGDGVLLPVPPVREGAALLGSTVSAKDGDDIIRRARLYDEAGGTVYPSLGLAPLLLDADGDGGGTASVAERAAGWRAGLPVRDDGTVLLRYKGGIDRYAHYRAYDILSSYGQYLRGEEPDIPPDTFEGAFVYFILYAPGLFDICSTPVSKVYPGAGVHITLLDGLLGGGFIRELPAPAAYGALFLCALLGMLCVRCAGRSVRHGTLLMVLAVLAGPCAICAGAYGLFARNLWGPLVAPLAGFLIAAFGAIMLGYSMEGHQKRFIKSAFSQYLSPAVIDAMIAQPHRLKLGGERRHISIFFSDVQGFTSLSEGLSPEALTELLNMYLTEMTNIILESGGTIDKYEGDAIIAFWNAPSDQDDHALRALTAAVRCQQRLDALADAFTARVGRPLWTRIGLNTGDAIVGNMGSSLRFDYTMLGDAVNLASRLEGLNKQFGTYLMCSLQTKAEAEAAGCALRWRELGRVAVVGKKEAVNVFEPVTEEAFRARENVYAGFARALSLFYAGKLAEAKAAFDALAPEDAPSRAYGERCALFLRQGGVPGSAWRGVWVASSK